MHQVIFENIFRFLHTPTASHSPRSPWPPCHPQHLLFPAILSTNAHCLLASLPRSPCLPTSWGAWTAEQVRP